MQLITLYLICRDWIFASNIPTAFRLTERADIITRMFLPKQSSMKVTLHSLGVSFVSIDRQSLITWAAIDVDLFEMG